MGRQRKTRKADIREAIVLAVLRGESSVSEAARQHGINESLIHTWKALPRRRPKTLVSTPRELTPATLQLAEQLREVLAQAHDLSVKRRILDLTDARFSVNEHGVHGIELQVPVAR